jgi:hypothetical protein
MAYEIYIQKSNGLDALFKSTRQRVSWKWDLNLPNICFRWSILHQWAPWIIIKIFKIDSKNIRGDQANCFVPWFSSKSSMVYPRVAYFDPKCQNLTPEWMFLFGSNRSCIPPPELELERIQNEVPNFVMLFVRYRVRLSNAHVNGQRFRANLEDTTIRQAASFVLATQFAHILPSFVWFAVPVEVRSILKNTCLECLDCILRQIVGVWT